MKVILEGGGLLEIDLEAHSLEFRISENGRQIITRHILPPTRELTADLLLELLGEQVTKHIRFRREGA